MKKLISQLLNRIHWLKVSLRLDYQNSLQLGFLGRCGFIVKALLKAAWFPFAVFEACAGRLLSGFGEDLHPCDEDWLTSAAYSDVPDNIWYNPPIENNITSQDAFTGSD